MLTLINTRLKKVMGTSLVTATTGLVLTACQDKGAKTSSNSKTDHSIALITGSNGVDDHPSNQAAWSGFQAYDKEHDLSQGKGGYQYFQLSSASDCEPDFTQAVNAGYQTIYDVGYMLSDSVEIAAAKYSKKNFIIVNDMITGKKNVASATFKSNDSSYLVGVATAYATKTNTVGFIDGAKSSVIDLFETGYIQGVKDTAKRLGKKIIILDQYIGDFISTDKAKSVTQSMYIRKADIVYQAAGSAGNGVLQEAKGLNSEETVNDKIWVIGIDIDQAPQGKYTAKGGQESNFALTSILKSLNFAVKDIANKACDGKFPGVKHLVYGLQHDGVSLTKSSLNSKAWKAVQQTRQDITDGKIEVATSPSK